MVAILPEDAKYGKHCRRPLGALKPAGLVTLRLGSSEGLPPSSGFRAKAPHPTRHEPATSLRRALKVRIALDLAARLSSPGSNPASNSISFLTCSEVSVRVRSSLRAISGASALKAQPAPGFLRCESLT